MKKLLQTMAEYLRRPEPLVLVTVTASSGAVPRGAGAHMLVGRQGRICGTIGGGAVEYRAIQLAGSVLDEQASRSHDFTLNRSDVENLGMICGGAVQVFFHYLPAGDPGALELATRAEAQLASGQDLWLLLDLAGGQMGLYCEEGGFWGLQPALELPLPRRPRLFDRLFVEQIGFCGRVCIFGGGHVAQELVPVLSHVGFRCVVMDDRPEFTRPELFPDAEQLITGDLRRIGDYLTVTPADYVCVMTRGHAYDTLVQAQLLRCHPCYCGVIGSAKKAAAVRAALQQDHGLTEEELNRITTPIGLPIQAETPAEIAISICAQLIQVRAGL